MPKTFDPEKDIGDLSGKVILVTGGNAGIGAATVAALASHSPKCLYLCARNTSTAIALVDNIKKTSPNANIEILPLDLASFESVKKCAAEFNNKSDRLDILFLNAGIAAVAPKLTKEGYEMQFGVNHMGHALLTQCLLPKMLETKEKDPTADLRICVTSSIGAARFAPPNGLALDQMHEPAALAHGMQRYGHSKLANVFFAKKLAQLYPGITSTSTHPGTVKSEIWDRADGMKWVTWALAPIIYFSAITTDEGAKTQLWTATAPVGENGVVSGKYYEPIGKATEPSAHFKDQGLADELWSWTNEELAKHGGPGWPKN